MRVQPSAATYTNRGVPYGRSSATRGKWILQKFVPLLFLISTERLITIMLHVERFPNLPFTTSCTTPYLQCILRNITKRLIVYYKIANHNIYCKNTTLNYGRIVKVVQTVSEINSKIWIRYPTLQQLFYHRHISLTIWRSLSYCGFESSNLSVRSQHTSAADVMIGGWSVWNALRQIANLVNRSPQSQTMVCSVANREQLLLWLKTIRSSGWQFKDI